MVWIYAMVSVAIVSLLSLVGIIIGASYTVSIPLGLAVVGAGSGHPRRNGHAPAGFAGGDCFWYAGRANIHCRLRISSNERRPMGGVCGARHDENP
ncbi:MAG: hypothetical protein FJ280_11830 [Planctomycetes bacterium]|nr:hypothetical protein [Planctomycetota bacterium]